MRSLSSPSRNVILCLGASPTLRQTPHHTLHFELLHRCSSARPRPRVARASWKIRKVGRSHEKRKVPLARSAGAQPDWRPFAALPGLQLARRLPASAPNVCDFA